MSAASSSQQILQPSFLPHNHATLHVSVNTAALCSLIPLTMCNQL